MTQRTANEIIRYYLVGKVPVELTEQPSGGVLVRAYNPLLGGFVADSRYYGAVVLEDQGRVVSIDRAAFGQAVESLRRAYGVSA